MINIKQQLAAISLVWKKAGREETAGRAPNTTIPNEIYTFCVDSTNILINELYACRQIL